MVKITKAVHKRRWCKGASHADNLVLLGDSWGRSKNEISKIEKSYGRERIESKLEKDKKALYW